MCVPYASDSGGMPVPGLGGIAGANANLFQGLTGTIQQSMAGLTGTNPGTIPTGAPSAGLSSGFVPPGNVPSADLVTANMPRPRPETAAVPGTEPVAGTPAPAVPAAATPPATTFGPGQTIYGGWKGPPLTWGTDPYPQTSGHLDMVSRSGHDSLSPLADMLSKRWTGGREGNAPAGPPLPNTRPGEAAAVPGTEPVASTPAATAPAAPALATKLAPGQLPDVGVMEAYIRKAAVARGIDPDVAVAVAKSEGLQPGTWQSHISGPGPGHLEPSYGPFQLNDNGLGGDFTAMTGLHASDPNSWMAGVDFALDQATTKGWAPFHGAERVGIGPMQGLVGAKGLGFGRGPRVAANGAPLVAFGGTAETPSMEAVNETTDPEVLAAAGVTPPAPAAAPRRGGTRGITYVNQGSIRSQPLDPKLEAVIDQATAPEGVTARVVSGGQPSSGPKRTGSHRHDNGMAGDVQFIKDGRALDMNVAADLEIVKRILGRIYGSGAQGIGASPAYMGSRTYHVGFGTPAVWGAGGQGKNAPPWLVAIAQGGGIPSTGGTAVASASPAASTPAPTQPGGIVGALASAAGRLGGGGGGGGGRAPGSQMESLIQEFLTADAARRQKIRDTQPQLGELPTQAASMVLPKDNTALPSLAQILGVS